MATRLRLVINHDQAPHAPPRETLAVWEADLKAPDLGPPLGLVDRAAWTLGMAAFGLVCLGCVEMLTHLI